MGRVVSVGSVLLALLVLVVILSTATLVDRRPPGVERVSLSATAGGERIAQTLSAIDIEFSEPVDRGSVERRFRIEPYVAGAITWDRSTAIFTPSHRLPPATQFAITIEPGFSDAAGNEAPSGLDGWTFTTVGQPTIQAVSPADGATGLAVDTTLSIRFDRLMDTRAVEAAVRIEPAATPKFSWAGDRLTVAFDRPLRFGTAYTLTVDARATDTAGNPLERPYAMRFTTVAAGLGVVRTVPAAGVAGASVGSPIAVEFDASIDPATAAGALRITPAVAGDTRVVDLPDDGVEARPPGRRILLFTPSSPLAPHTTYTVTLNPVVARADDPLRVAEGRTWSFTTGARSPSIQNQIAFLSARSGVRNLWLMNPDGSNARQLTSELTPVTGFDVTGDGAWIVYGSAGSVWLTRADGSERRRLTADGAFEYAPVLTPDGRAVLVGRRSAAGADLGYWLVPISPIIGGAERQILASGAPPLGSAGLEGDAAVGGDGASVWAGRAAFEPSGRSLLVVTGSGEAVVVDLGEPGLARSPTVSSTGLVAEAAPVWLPAREQFGLVARESGRSASSVWTIGRDNRSNLGASASGSLDAAPDGTMVALARPGPGTAAVVALLRPGASALEPLGEPAALDDRWPAFAPDGSLIVFSRIGPRPGSRSAGLWVVGRSGAPAAQLTPDGSEPRWLP